jgi:hypothetical protein
MLGLNSQSFEAISSKTLEIVNKIYDKECDKLVAHMSFYF